jgi:hypothetical protein
MYRLNHNQAIIEVLEKLKDSRVDYPPHLFAKRRMSFIKLISYYVAEWCASKRFLLNKNSQ